MRLSTQLRRVVGEVVGRLRAGFYVLRNDLLVVSVAAVAAAAILWLS